MNDGLGMTPLEMLLPFGLGAKRMKARRDAKKAGDNPRLYIDQYGVVRTLPGVLTQEQMKLDTSGGPSAILPNIESGGRLIAPGGPEQVQRLLGLQQAEDERAKLARLSEDDYKFTTQLEKDRATRLGQLVDLRQRVATRGNLIAQGQLGNQELAQQSARNRGSVMAQAPQLS